MRSVASVALLVGAITGVALAGPLDSPLPTNPCDPAIPFKLALVANEVGSDSGGPTCASGGGCVATMVVCFHTGATGRDPIDIGIELFDDAGVLLTPIASACAVAAGASAAFVSQNTPTLGPPYVGTPITAGPQVPRGALRILSTGGVACDVTLIDTRGTSRALWTQDVTVTRTKLGQRGD